MTRWMRTAVLVAGMTTAGTAGAEVSNNVTFRGRLIAPPPCTLDEGRVIDVDFGQRVGIRKVNGVNYLQPVPYRVACTGDAGTQPWEMVLTFSGTPTIFDEAAVQTDKAGLGIRILKEGLPFKLNTPVKITPGNYPKLEAVPVQSPGATLTEGPFEALATLRVDYQ